MREIFLYKGIPINNWKEILELDITIWNSWWNNKSRKWLLMMATTIPWEITGLFLASSHFGSLKVCLVGAVLYLKKEDGSQKEHKKGCWSQL